MHKSISLFFLLIAWAMSGVALATPVIDEGQPNVCIYHLSEGISDTYDTPNCDVVIAEQDDGLLRASATAFEVVPGVPDGTNKMITSDTIQGGLPCMLWTEDFRYYITYDYENVVSKVPGSGLPGEEDKTLLVLRCFNLESLF